LNLFSFVGDVILDPFAGSGTTFIFADKSALFFVCLLLLNLIDKILMLLSLTFYLLFCLLFMPPILLLMNLIFAYKNK